MYAVRKARPQARRAETRQWPAPVAGWISNRALATPNGVEGPGAAILDNFFPKATGVALRRGRATYATLEDDSLPVTALFTYRAGAVEKLFGANENTIYDLTNVISPYNLLLVNENGDSVGSEDDGVIGTLSTEGLDVATGYSGGDWTTVQFATTGGVFLIGVNGVDEGFIYDGGTFDPLAITFGDSGLTTADMSYVWTYKNRLFFVEKNSLSFWYLPADAIAGDAEIFPMGGIFTLGGSLLFGQRWSLESGGEGGLSEQNVFVTTQGEVAIYQGDSPDEAATWNLVGVYRIGPPLGKNAFVRGGGDLAIATTVGLVPLSKAISLDVTALNVATVSYKIADAWAEAIEMRGQTGWETMIWPEAKMAIISPPDRIGSHDPVLFISNTETGAWARYTGWDVRTMTVFRGRMIFGSANGSISFANTGGRDEREVYTGVIVPLFDDMGTSASAKIGKIARARTRSTSPVKGKISMLNDFQIDRIPPAPDAGTTGDQSNLWGGAVWGESIWGGELPIHVNQDWRSIGNKGYSIAPCYQVSSGSITPLDLEMIDMELAWTTAGIVT